MMGCGQFGGAGESGAGGMRSAGRRHVSRLLSSLRAFPVTERVAWRAAEFMREYRRSHQGIGAR
jgi:predicted nucleic acid-binding protein